MRWFKQKRVYLDYASAPLVSSATEKAMREAARYIGNPGAIHAEGVEAKKALDNARERIAKLLEAKPREIVFTSGLTEANNLAILGAARALERTRRTLEGTHWIVSSIEHASILDCFAEIERLGGAVTHLDPDPRGLILPEAVGKALRPETVFVSVGWANNEIGTLQPLARISRILREHAAGENIIFHSDAGQAPLYLSTTAHSLGVDLLSLGGNKLYGPHGVGALYVNNRSNLVRVLQGGPQERGLRPGTENVALALGFAAAFEETARMRHEESDRLQKLRDTFAEALVDTIPGIIVNGSLKHSLPHMLNISIPNIQSEYLTLQLDKEGIAISTKSACREGEESRSHVVEALQGEPWRSQNTLRFSLGTGTYEVDIRRVIDTLSALVHRDL